MITDMKENTSEQYRVYPWVPFFKELVNSLLKFKENRNPLLKWLKEEIAISKGMDKRELKFCGTLIDPLRTDIDPFSVVSILCKKYYFESLETILQKYKTFFKIQSEASSSDWGMVTNNNIDFLFSKNEVVINTLWDLFDKILAGVDASSEYDQLLEGDNTYFYLTHVLSWTRPEQYLALNEPIREYLKKYNISIKRPPTYEQYQKILKQVKTNMDNGLIPCTSFLQLTELVQKEGRTPKIWFVPAPKDIMIYGKSYILEYIAKQKKKETDLFYSEVLPRWDIIVLYETIKENNKKFQRLYGWGRFNNKKLRLSSNMFAEIEWHPYVENGFIWDYSVQEGIYKLNAENNILGKLRINNQKMPIDMKTTKYKMFTDLLEKNKNLILTGAPGTGKTYMAKAIAAELMGIKDTEELMKDKNFGFVQYHPSYDYTDFVEGLRPTEKEGQIGFKRENGVFKEFCKNALLTIVKPNTIITKENAKAALFYFKEHSNGKVLWRSFDKGSGIFTVLTHFNAPIYAVFCIDEYSTPIPYKVSEEKIIEYLINPQINSNEKDDYEESIADYINEFILNNKRKCVFIIDEINRGEISKIFGELFFSIDPDYRGEKGIVFTQYQNMVEKEDVFYNGFFVPKNVYIIGTMNDIDRSVDSMDFAMRRRFYFHEVTAEKSYENMIENDPDFTSVKDAIKKRMFSLNKAIARTDGLNEAYQIGAAYFRKYLDYKDEKRPFECLWNNHLKSLLQEYLRGNKKKDVLLNNLYKAYNLENSDE